MRFFINLCLFKANDFKNIKSIDQHFFFSAMVWESTKFSESIVEDPFHIRKFDLNNDQHIFRKCYTLLSFEGSWQEAFCLQVTTDILIYHLDFFF